MSFFFYGVYSSTNTLYIISIQHMVFPGLETSGRGLLVHYSMKPFQLYRLETVVLRDIKEVQETLGRVFCRAQATCEGEITTAL